MKVRFVVFLTTILSIYTVLNVFIGWHGLLFMKQLDLTVAEGLYWPIFGLFVYAYMLGRLPVTRWMQPFVRLLKVIGSIYIAIMEFALLLLLAADIIALVAKASNIYTDAYILYAGLVVLSIIVLLLIRGSWNAWIPKVVTYKLHIAKSAGAIKRLQVAVVSDLHLGNLVGNRHLDRLLGHLKVIKPDLILLPGDVIDDSIEPFIRNHMIEKMKLLKAKYGVYAVLGNHEYYGGHMEDYVERMNGIGIRVLRDEIVTIQDNLHIIGRKDKTAESSQNGRSSVAELVGRIKQDGPVIMMDHQPYQFDKAAAAGINLLLCGHTHRGQFAPNHWITKRLFELDWGYMLKGAMHVVVSSGFGTWGPPIRIASRSEIIKLEITFD